MKSIFSVLIVLLCAVPAFADIDFAFPGTKLAPDHTTVQFGKIGGKLPTEQPVGRREGLRRHPVRGKQPRHSLHSGHEQRTMATLF